MSKAQAVINAICAEVQKALTAVDEGPVGAAGLAAALGRRVLLDTPDPADRPAILHDVIEVVRVWAGDPTVPPLETGLCTECLAWATESAKCPEHSGVYH